MRFKSVCLCVAVLGPLPVGFRHYYLGPGSFFLLVYLCGPGPESLQAVQEHRWPGGQRPAGTQSWRPGALCYLHQPGPWGRGGASCTCSLRWCGRDFCLSARWISESAVASRFYPQLYTKKQRWWDPVCAGQLADHPSRFRFWFMACNNRQSLQPLSEKKNYDKFTYPNTWKIPEQNVIKTNSIMSENVGFTVNKDCEQMEVTENDHSCKVL